MQSQCNKDMEIEDQCETNIGEQSKKQITHKLDQNIQHEFKNQGKQQNQTNCSQNIYKLINELENSEIDIQTFREIQSALYDMYDSNMKECVQNINNFVQNVIKEKFTEQYKQVELAMQHINESGTQLINNFIQKTQSNPNNNQNNEQFQQNMQKEFHEFKQKQYRPVMRRYIKEMLLEKNNIQKEFHNFLLTKQKKIDDTNFDVEKRLRLIQNFNSIEQIKTFSCYQLEGAIQAWGKECNISEMLENVNTVLFNQHQFIANRFEVPQESSACSKATDNQVPKYRNCAVYKSFEKPCNTIIIETIIGSENSKLIQKTVLHKQDSQSLKQIFQSRHKQYVLKHMDGEECPIKLFTGQKRFDPEEYRDKKMQIMWGMNCIKQFMIGGGVFYQKRGVVYRDAQIGGLGLDKNNYAVDNGA